MSTLKKVLEETQDDIRIGDPRVEFHFATNKDLIKAVLPVLEEILEEPTLWLESQYGDAAREFISYLKQLAR